MVTKNSKNISAEVILKSKSGKSFIDSNVNVTSKNVADFYPTKKTIEDAKRQLQQMGFRVPISKITMTIEGEPKKFESIFKIKLQISENKLNRLSISCQSDPVIPDSLKNFVEKIIFPEEPEYF